MVMTVLPAARMVVDVTGSAMIRALDVLRFMSGIVLGRVTHDFKEVRDFNQGQSASMPKPAA